MTRQYSTEGSSVLLRPQKVNLPTQSAENCICMEKWAWENWGVIISAPERP